MFYLLHTVFCFCSNNMPLLFVAHRNTSKGDGGNTLRNLRFGRSSNSFNSCFMWCCVQHSLNTKDKEDKRFIWSYGVVSRFIDNMQSAVSDYTCELFETRVLRSAKERQTS